MTEEAKKKTTAKSPDTLTTVLGVVDGVIELYLKSFVAPFLQFHEVFYNHLNVVCKSLHALMAVSCIGGWVTHTSVSQISFLFVGIFDPVARKLTSPLNSFLVMIFYSFLFSEKSDGR